MSELVATATATAGSLHHRALKYQTCLTTPLATNVAVSVAVAANLDTASHCIEMKMSKMAAL